MLLLFSTNNGVGYGLSYPEKKLPVHPPEQAVNLPLRKLLCHEI